ncbi:MAG: hypothetical protein OXH15_16880 [Gammaproteobacteria bacterium]|nr:hypothetical protein [Gammaproteobacteria bacterium]
MDTFQFVTLVLTPVVAIYGAGLATWTALRGWRADKPSVFVSYGWVFDIPMGANPSALTLTAVNDGRRDLIVESLSLEVPGYCCITPAFLDILGLSRGNSPDGSVGRQTLGLGRL